MIFAGGEAYAWQEKFIDDPSGYETLASNGKKERKVCGTKYKEFNQILVL